MDLKLEVCKLFDGKLQIRLDNEDVYLLPNKHECEGEDIARMIRNVLEKFEQLSPPVVDKCEW